MHESDRVRTALIGCGKVGRIHARALSQLPESEFVAVCDSDPKRAESFATEFNVSAFSNISEMVHECGVQVVSVCTPHPLHAVNVIEATACGAHVLVEKPLASNLRDCDLMIASAERHSRQLGVVSQRRFFEPVQRIKAAIDAGKIGNPILGTMTMLSWRDEAYYRSDPWRGKWATEGGGVLVNQSPHQLDILQWLMGPIEEITGYWGNLNHPAIEVDDTAVACVRFRTGALASIVTSVSQKPGIYTNVHIHGSNGASVGVQTDTGATFIAGVSETEEPPVNDFWTIPGEEDLLAGFIADDRARFRERRDPDHYHKLQIQDFLRAVSTGTRPLVTGQDGRIVVEMFTAIYLSTKDHRPVRFPLPSSSGPEAI
jgi:UDP-N-acetyl-2-amino-2-deoxyglucuronate dehydrogenase